MEKVLTLWLFVPAIWRPAAKQFMREAARKVIVEKLHLFVSPPPPPHNELSTMSLEVKMKQEKENTGRARIQVTVMLSVSKHECFITNVKVLFFLLGGVRKNREI